MLFSKLFVKHNQRAVVVRNGRLTDVLATGKHMVWHGMKPTEIHLVSLQDLSVAWSGVADTVRFDRTAAERYWQIVDSDEGEIKLVWHKYLPVQIVDSGKSEAFWRPEDGSSIHLHTLSKNDYWLPEDVQKAILANGVLSHPRLKHFSVQSNQRILVTVRGQLVHVEGEGEYVLHFPEDNSVNVSFADVLMPVFSDNVKADWWAASEPDITAQYFERVDADTNELVLWSADGVSGAIWPSRHHYFWKNSLYPYRLHRIDLSHGLKIRAADFAWLEAIDFRNSNLYGLVNTISVPPHHQAVVCVAGQQPEILSSGEYHYWNIGYDISSQILDMRIQTCEVNGQELLTADKVTVRINAVCDYRIIDAQAWTADNSDSNAHLYRQLQFAIRALVSSKSIDGLLAEKDSMGTELLQWLRAKNIGGIALHAVDIKDVILPGEIRDILIRVVEAEKAAQANNIRRREETAATRSLLNTARVMEDNPTALRLKELETLEKVTEKIDKISVYGGLDGVLNGLINIQNGTDKTS